MLPGAFTHVPVTAGLPSLSYSVKRTLPLSLSAPSRSQTTLSPLSYQYSTAAQPGMRLHTHLPLLSYLYS